MRDDMREEFDIRASTCTSVFSIPGVTAVKPLGAFYVLANISGLGLKSQNFADRLLSKANVAVVPVSPLRRPHRPPELRDEPRRHQDRPRPHRGVLQDAVTPA